MHINIYYTYRPESLKLLRIISKKIEILLRSDIQFSFIEYDETNLKLRKQGITGTPAADTGEAIVLSTDKILKMLYAILISCNPSLATQGRGRQEGSYNSNDYMQYLVNDNLKYIKRVGGGDSRNIKITFNDEDENDRYGEGEEMNNASINERIAEQTSIRKMNVDKYNKNYNPESERDNMSRTRQRGQHVREEEFHERNYENDNIRNDEDEEYDREYQLQYKKLDDKYNKDSINKKIIDAFSK